MAVCEMVCDSELGMYFNITRLEELLRHTESQCVLTL